jgi:hypothetical protein
VIDGVRYCGEVYRLVGFDTPERADNARCDDECRRAQASRETALIWINKVRQFEFSRNF